MTAWRDENRTRLRHLRQSGSARVVFPQSNSDGLQAVLVNTAGGITGGDVFSYDATVEAGGQLTLTTQAAERAYRAQPHETGRITTRVDVETGGRFEWLPQETILFDGCALERNMQIDLGPGGEMLFVEPLVFGRALMDEQVRRGVFRDRVSVRCGGALVYCDAMSFQGDISAQLQSIAVMNRAVAMATVVYIAADAEARLPAVRSRLTGAAGASLITDTLLCARFVAKDSFVLRQSLVPVLNILSNNTLPRPWML